jgi:hypothetical protein
MQFGKHPSLLPCFVLLLLSFQLRLAAQDVTIPLSKAGTSCSMPNKELTCGWSNGTCSHHDSLGFDTTTYVCSTDSNGVAVITWSTLQGCFPSDCRVLIKTQHCNINFTMNSTCTEADPSDQDFDFIYETTSSAPACGCNC